MSFNLRIKSINNVIKDAKKQSLPKTLGALDLVLLGIGCTIGTGIFVITGTAAANYAGPAISISYLLAGLVCVFAGLAYAELAAMMPVAGSAYTYSYTVMGEFIAWIVACGLLLEYMVGASTVSSGWSGYFVGILKQSGINLPEYLVKVPSEGGLINLPASLIALSVGLILMRGTKESAMINRILVAIKLIIIFAFLYVSAPFIKSENYTDFAPFGIKGIITGAAAIFYAYLGFDAVATAAEETKNPNRNLPIGIIVSLIICGLLYILVSLALTGIVSYKELGNAEPMAYALRANGSNIGSALIGTGAMFGMVAVLLVLMYGQSRIFFVMSRDGLLPPIFSKLHKKFNTPYFSCLFVTISVAIIAGLTPIRTLGDMASFGTLFAFAISALIVIILKVKKPELERPFKCPSPFIVGGLAFIGCTYLMFKLVGNSPKIFAIWLIISIIFYFSFGYLRSPFNKNK
jgi:APA family basic amino acid/polyamine antiporter